MDEREALKLSQDDFVKAIESWIEKLEKIELKLRGQIGQKTRSST